MPNESVPRRTSRFNKNSTIQAKNAKGSASLDDSRRLLHHGKKWGRWTLDAERLALVLDAQPVTRGEGANQYVALFGINEFDLELRASSQFLDRVFQFRTLGYVDAQCLSDLLEALDDIIYPQENLCSFGSDKRIEKPAEFLRTRIRESELQEVA
jgi:hypothetical protein